MYLIDYHTHTRLSPDSEAPLAEMAQAAVRAGLSELCVTDHYDLLELDGTPAAAPCDWAPAVEQLREAQDAFRGRLTLRLGLELGSAPFFPDKAQAAVDRPEVDFVIGSLHNLTPEAGGGDFYFVDYQTPETCYACLDNYFGSMLRLAPMSCCDALGHIIYPLRYMNLRSGQDRMSPWTATGTSSGRFCGWRSTTAVPSRSTPTTAARWTTGGRCCPSTGRWGASWSLWAPTPTAPKTWPRGSGRPMNSWPTRASAMSPSMKSGSPGL